MQTFLSFHIPLRGSGGGPNPTTPGNLSSANFQFSMITVPHIDVFLMYLSTGGEPHVLFLLLSLPDPSSSSLLEKGKTIYRKEHRT